MRLKKLRIEHGISQKDLGKKFNAAQNTISNWENGTREIPQNTLIEIANFFNVSTDYLLGRVGSNIDFIEVDRNTIKIPVFGYIPAGIPMEAIEDISEYIKIPEEWTNGGKEFFALTIKGDSMFPEYLPGDIVIFEKSQTCETGCDCAVMVNGDDATFKRVERKENGIVLKPLNTTYETAFYTNKEIETKPIHILGIAKELRRRK